MNAGIESAQLARLEERVGALLESLQRNWDSQNRIEIWMRSVDTLMVKMDSRVQLLEMSQTHQQKAIDEFQIMKHKVQGASLFGKWAWFFIGGILGGFSTYQGILTHLAK